MKKRRNYVAFKKLAELSKTPAECRVFSPCVGLPLPVNKIGIEIEMENAPGFDVLRRKGLWNVIRDNSLRNGGVELVSIPLFGEDIITALEQVEKATAGKGQILNERTSVHIHLDVLDMNREGLTKILLLYTALERVLFKYCAEHRRHNAYCLPYYKAEQFKKLLSTVFRSILDGDVERTKHHVQRWPKYSALNINRIVDIGTVEFRQLHGTVNKEEILTWIKIIMCIKRYAMHNMQGIDDFPTVVSGFAVDDYLVDIFGEDLADVLVYPHIEEDLLKGVRYAQDVLLTGPLNKLQDKLYVAYDKERGKKDFVSSYVKLYGKDAAKPGIDPMEYTLEHAVQARAGTGITPGTIRWAEIAAVANTTVPAPPPRPVDNDEDPFD